MKTITLSKGFTVLTHPDGSVQVILDVKNTFKQLGVSCGLYSCAEDNYNSRVVVAGIPEMPALEIQEDISYHGSPCWDTVEILTTDKERIDAYMQFRKILEHINQKWN